MHNNGCKCRYTFGVAASTITYGSSVQLICHNCQELTTSDSQQPAQSDMQLLYTTYRYNMLYALNVTACDKTVYVGGSLSSQTLSSCH